MVMLIVDFVLLLLIICLDWVSVECIVYVLVGECLVVCVICFDGVQFIYCWQGEVIIDVELQLLVKIIVSCVDDVIVWIVELYLYEFLECIVVEIWVGLLVYLDWIWVQIWEDID